MEDEIREEYHWVGGALKKETLKPVTKKQGGSKFRCWRVLFMQE